MGEVGLAEAGGRAAVQLTVGGGLAGAEACGRLRVGSQPLERLGRIGVDARRCLGQGCSRRPPSAPFSSSPA
jgi:hypothetical protein